MRRILIALSQDDYSEWDINQTYTYKWETFLTQEVPAGGAQALEPDLIATLNGPPAATREDRS